MLRRYGSGETRHHDTVMNDNMPKVHSHEDRPLVKLAGVTHRSDCLALVAHAMAVAKEVGGTVTVDVTGKDRGIPFRRVAFAPSANN